MDMVDRYVIMLGQTHQSEEKTRHQIATTHTIHELKAGSPDAIEFANSRIIKALKAMVVNIEEERRVRSQRR